jgi:tetratricopeptide (TPR) repeat protein
VDAALQLIDEVDFSGSVAILDRWRAEWNVAQALQVNGELERALKRVRLLLKDSLSVAIPAALDIRLRWLEAYLSLEAKETDGLEERVARLLARLNSLPKQGENSLAEEDVLLLETEILLLQGDVLMRGGHANAGMVVLTQLRKDFSDTAASQRSYLIEAAYHGLVGDFVSAQATLTNLAQIYPNSPLAPQALFEAALYCERRGADFYPQAVILHNDLAERYASDPLFYFARLKQGNLLRSMNDFAGAQIVYENLINGFPSHDLRYIAELSRADCMLALAGNEPSALGDVVVILERLLDLPNLPLDFQAEAAHKWAFALIKRNSMDKAKEVLSLSVSRFLLDGQKAEELGVAGRYWVARSMLQLGEVLEEEGSLVEARRVYRKLIAYDLPGRHIAISRADRLLDVK